MFSGAICSNKLFNKNKYTFSEKKISNGKGHSNLFDAYHSSSNMKLDTNGGAAIASHENSLIGTSYIADHGRKNIIKSKDELRTLLHTGYQIITGRHGPYIARGLMAGMQHGQVACRAKEISGELWRLPANIRSVFISYHWGDEETAVANGLCDILRERGYHVIRDVLANGNFNIVDFMNLIDHPRLTYVIPIISEAYLGSVNCMYEASQITRRYTWGASTFPMIMPDYNWERGAHNNLGNQYQTELNNTPQNLELDRRKLEEIINTWGEFLNGIQGTLRTPIADMQRNGYEELFAQIDRLELERSSYIPVLIANIARGRLLIDSVNYIAAARVYTNARNEIARLGGEESELFYRNILNLYQDYRVLLGHLRDNPNLDGRDEYYNDGIIANCDVAIQNFERRIGAIKANQHIDIIDYRTLVKKYGIPMFIGTIGVVLSAIFISYYLSQNSLSEQTGHIKNELLELNKQVDLLLGKLPPLADNIDLLVEKVETVVDKSDSLLIQLNNIAKKLDSLDFTKVLKNIENKVDLIYSQSNPTLLGWISAINVCLAIALFCVIGDVNNGVGRIIRYYNIPE